jgi:hypothetical protein
MEQAPPISALKVLADGSKSFESGGYTFVVKPDGTRIATHEDGGSLIFKPDGTVVAQFANGTKVTKKPDGTKIQEMKDGHKIMILPDSPKKPIKPTGRNRRAYRLTQRPPVGTEIDASPDPCTSADMQNEKAEQPVVAPAPNSSAATI